MFELSDHEFGRLRTPTELAVMRAVEEVYTAFCDWVDDGDLERAMTLHIEDVTIHELGKREPIIGQQRWLERLKKVRFSYPGRRTLHTPSNFRFHRVTAEVAECRMVTSLYDLLKNPQGPGIDRYSTELVGYAAEEARFVPVDGLWRFHTRKVWFLAGAKRLPIGTLPGQLAEDLPVGQ